MTTRSIFSVRHEQPLSTLLAGDALTTVIEQLVLLALPTLALTQAGLSASQTSLLIAAQWLPALLLGGRFGKLTDRYDRRVVFILACLMTAIGTGAMLTVDAPPSWQRQYYLLACCLMYATGITLYQICSTANVPQLVIKITVEDAIAHQASVRSMARLLGLALAGPALQWLGTTASLALTTLLALARVALLLTLPPNKALPAASHQGKEGVSAGTLAWRQPTLRQIVLANAMMNAGSAMIISAFFAFAYQILNLTPFNVGTMLFIGGCSAVAAAWYSRHALHHLPTRRLCGWTGLGAGLTVWLIPASAYLPGLPTLLAYEALFSALVTLFAISFSVLRQSLTPRHQLGQMVAISATANAGAMVAGSLLGATIIENGSLLLAICIGCAMCSGGAFGLISLTRSKIVPPDASTQHQEIAP